MSNIKCEHCDNQIRIDGGVKNIKCSECGATYALTESTVEEDRVLQIYDFLEFRCVKKSYFNDCQNKCIAPEMFCLEHLTDENFTSIHNEILRAAEKLQEAKDILEKMEESKKNWLIQEVSGLIND